MQYTAMQLQTNALYQSVNVAAHGFTQTGYIVRLNGATFVGARANSEANAAVVGMISSIPNVDQFYITQEGFVSGITVSPAEGGAFTPGAVYYLSQTTGLLTATKPITPGQVELPCYIPYTATSGFFFASVGNLINAPAEFSYFDVINDLTMVSNTGYNVNATAFSISLDLPGVSVLGDQIEIMTANTSVDDVLVVCNGSQYITLADAQSTAGQGLILSPTNGIKRGSCFLRCCEANLGWRFVYGTGNWAVV